MEIARYPLFIAGVGFIFYGLWGLIRSLRRHCVCQGIILGYEKHQEHALFAPRVEFIDPGGISHTFISQFYGSQDIPAGGRVHVRYFSGDPKRAEVARFSTRWLFPLVWLGFVLVFVLASVLTPKETGTGGNL